jgi:hypothetical protein
MTAARLAAACASAWVLLTLAGPVRAQDILEDQPAPVLHRFRSPQHFAFELRFGPYHPAIDSEFEQGGTQLRRPYHDYFGDSNRLMTQLEFDWQLIHRFGSLGVGASLGYFQVSGASPLADASGNISGDRSTLKIVPLALSAVYRFDYFLIMRDFPLVPYGKLGLDYAYWQITDGNDEIAHDGVGGNARGGTTGWHAAAGLELVLDIFDPEAARDFDTDLGVNHTALVLELSHADISGLGRAGRLHVGDTTWSLGLLLEF